jgi:hypothetical protein
LGTARSPIRVARKRKRQSPALVEDPELPDFPSRPRTTRHQDSREGSEDSEDGATRPQKRAALGTARNPRVARKLATVPCRLRHRHTCHAPQEEVFTFLEEDGELTASELDSEPSASDQNGHDDRQPKRRASASDFGASLWTTQEWKLLLASCDVSDSDDSSEDDGKP